MSKTLKVKLKFTEEVLGTSSPNPDIHAEYIASKAPSKKTSEQESEDLEQSNSMDRSMTIFPKEKGIPYFYDYQFKGYFKDTCSALSRVPGTKSKDLKAHKKVIDGLIFPKPRKIFINMPKGSVISDCQRPLRAQTAQGERIALASSETIPAGSTVEFEIFLMDPGHEGLIKEWLDYGQYKGMGQWRNSGKGKFTYTLS